ncbi:MAG TPA: 2'-5' RNA ligase family protein [Candidatus Saccharimonadales bacterium]|jgi:2'-5' RNA ligase
MQKYVLVKLLEKLDEGTIFLASEWPLHVTLVANFVVDWEATNLYEKLSSLLERHSSIQVTAGDDEYFGPDQSIRVTVLNMNNELKSFHNNLVSVLKNANAVFDEPRFLEEGYRAHATVQRELRLNKSDLVTIDELTIVDMFPEGDINKRKVLQTIKLSA